MVDNVEQVEITNTVAGTYTVLINHKGDLVNSSGKLDGQEVSIILSGLIPEDIDPRSYISLTTNGYPRIELPDKFGILYEISRKEHLNYSPVWEVMTNSPVYVLHAEDEWISPTTSTNQAFYRILETE